MMKTMMTMMMMMTTMMMMMMAKILQLLGAMFKVSIIAWSWLDDATSKEAAESAMNGAAECLRCKFFKVMLVDGRISDWKNWREFSLTWTRFPS